MRGKSDIWDRLLVLVATLVWIQKRVRIHEVWSEGWIPQKDCQLDFRLSAMEERLPLATRHAEDRMSDRMQASMREVKEQLEYHLEGRMDDVMEKMMDKMSRLIRNPNNQNKGKAPCDC